MKSKKVFLKRAKPEGLSLDQLFVGASVNIFSRQVFHLIIYIYIYIRFYDHYCDIHIHYRPFILPQNSQLKIVDFADDYTKRMLSNKQERAFVYVKSTDLPLLGVVLDQLCGKGLVLASARMGFIAATDAQGEREIEREKGGYY